MSHRYINPASAPGDFDPKLKVGWARHHLRLLNAEMRKFSDSDLHGIHAYEDLEAGEYVLTITDDAMNVEMALMVGDWASCLRGSLDHLATHLTHCTGGKVNNRASFPVIGEWNNDGRRLFKQSIAGVPLEAVKIIDSFQPYHSGAAYERTKLWRLHKLWNIDKHRRIPIHPSISQVKIGHPSDVSPLPGWADNRGVVRFPLAVKSQVDFDSTVKVTAYFGDSSEGIILPYEELIDIHNFVRAEIMPAFDKFFKPLEQLSNQ